MGVPAFFRWLSKKFPSIVVEANANFSLEYDFDNFYLDMNGIIHPCTHPEYKTAPETENEMFEAIFEYIDMLMKLVRPRRLLYMAVDGVAPRAKMNQQRSRRFRAAKESQDKKIEIEKIKNELKEKGVIFENNNENKTQFDSNVITPGTQFMINLSEALQKWIDKKLDHSKNNEESNLLWHKDLNVILSDASAPGEGEHKIMEFIRKQKAKPGYNPNLSHCLCGADADLIMLGLATHELNFTIIREEFKPNQPKPCEICSQLGHDMKECKGEARKIVDKPIIPLDPGFIFIRLSVLREYLAFECDQLDIERFIDDFVFLCFFVGNDFLPHLPSLEIREGAIDRLIEIYKRLPLDSSDPHLTKDGFVNLKRVQMVLRELGKVEDDIFRKRKVDNKKYKNKLKRLKLEKEKLAAPYQPEIVLPRGLKPEPLLNARVEAANFRMAQNITAAEKMKAMLVEDNHSQEESRKRKREEDEKQNEEENENSDQIKLGVEGWKERYYYHKFNATEHKTISKLVCKEYVVGLCWVLRYYYQGCSDWQWFYPYHYAPFASDFVDIEEIKIKFNPNSRPFRPLEQLMSVFPAASSNNLPDSWRKLMVDPCSKIIDFYPEKFKIDLNGKLYEWQGVALLPLIDEDRLHEALSKVYPDLNEEEINRNSIGPHLLFVSKHNMITFERLNDLFEGSVEEKDLDSDFIGIFGKVKISKKYSHLHKNARCVEFYDPLYPTNYVFRSIRLKGARAPPKVIKDTNEAYTNWKPMIGMSHVESMGRSVNVRVIQHYTSNYQDRSNNRNSF